MTKLINQTEFPRKDILRLINVVVGIYKRSFKFTPIKEVVVKRYRSERWDCQYDGDGNFVIRLGTKVKFPVRYHGLGVDLLTWEDWFVSMFAWNMMSHIQRCKYLAEKQRTGVKPKRQYYNREIDEFTQKIVKRWRVDLNMKLIMEKIDA